MSEEVRITFAKEDVNYEPKVPRKWNYFGRNRASRVEPEHPNNTPTPPQSSWFERLNIEKNHVIEPPPNYVIDVQPDFRYPLAYITYCIRELYDNADLNELKSQVSQFTLIYYCQTLVVATLLFYDLFNRPQKSNHAALFRQDPPRIEFSNLLFELKVPDFMAQILPYLSPVHDGLQPSLFYVPSLAGFSFRHDFGRLVPPAVFLAAHSLCGKHEDPMENVRNFHSTKIISIGSRDYYVTNFLGGPYTDGDEVCDRFNWIRQDIDYFVSVGVSNDSNFNYFPLKYGHERDINPYDLMFCFDDVNKMGLLAILTSVSRFFHEKEPSSLSLGSLLSSPVGLTMLTHFYSSPTLPTCHALPPPPVVFEKEHSFIDDAQFAAKTRFLSTVSVKSDVNKVRFSPLGLTRFDRFINVRGDIVGYQPYGKDYDTLGMALTLGLTIENGDIDGVTVSLTNPPLSHSDNLHSLQGSLPIRVVHAYIPDFKPDNKLVLIKRADHSSFPNNPVGFARGDMGRVISSPEQMSGVDVNEGVYTYTAWKRSDERLPIPDSSIYFWSSYRFVIFSQDGDILDVYMFYTMKALYGNAGTMTKVKCPAWLFPTCKPFSLFCTDT